MKSFLRSCRSAARDVLQRGLSPVRAGVVPRDNLHHLQAVQRDGFSILEDYIPAETCDRMAELLDAAFVEYAEFVQHHSDGAEQRLFGADRVSQELGLLWNDKLLESIMKAYCATDKLIGFTMANRIEAREGNKGSGNGWHRDSIRGRQFKAIMYLNDVGLENGPFQYWRGSHRPWHRIQTAYRLSEPYDQNRFDDGSFEEAFNNSEVLTFTARKGTVLLADTTGLHRGQPLTTGVRYAMTNYYFNNRVSEHIDKLVLKKPAMAT